MNSTSLPSGWHFVTVDDIKAPKDGAIAIGPFGSRMKADRYVPVGVPVIRGNNLTGLSTFGGDFVYVSNDTADSMPSCNAFDGDIVFPHRGAIGQVGIVPADGKRYMISTSLMKLSCDRDIANPRFLYYFFRSDAGRHELLKNASTVGTPGIGQPLSTLRSIRLPLPPKDEQDRIADILGTLDDKIELNRRMNETLEAMARRLFKSWFVDFDPVHAKAALRREYPKLTNVELSRGALPKMAPEVAELFPDSFEHSPLGRIPKGWRVQPLEMGLSILETGSRPKGGVKHITSGVPSVGAESIVGIGRFDFGKTKYVPEEFFNSMNKGHIKDRDVLLYKDGGRPGEYEPHVSMFGDGFPFRHFCINEHVYRLRANTMLTQEFLYFWLTSDSPMEEMRVKGTGVAIPGLNSTAVKSLATLMPDQRVVAAFSNVIVPATSAIFANCNKSKVQAGLRDRLLPRLLSGDLRITDSSQ